MGPEPMAPVMDWPDAVFDTLKDAGVRQVAYVPTPGTRA